MKKLADELKILIRSRFPIIYLLTHEEDRAEELLKSISASLKKRLVTWTVTDDPSIPRSYDRAVSALEMGMGSAEPTILVLRDFHPYLENDVVIRKMRDMAESFSKSHNAAVIVAPTLKIPPELEKEITIVDLPLPDRDEMFVLLEETLNFATRNPRLSVCLTDDEKHLVVDAALGLTLSEARRIFSKALLNDYTFDAGDIGLILYEKKQLIRKSGILEYYDSSETISSVGGMESMKKWLVARRGAYTRQARDYGLPVPKGLMLLGVQGCGKSLTSKAVASLWNQPLLKLDMGKIFSSFIGSSEENMRKAIATAESLAPVILWIDEIEKGFSGIKSSGATDAGVTARIFGAFLTWMQEKTKAVFVIATANSICDLPPELLRKGRFDEIFFIDLPKESERSEIFRIHLEKRGRKADNYRLAELAKASEGYSGAEIEMAVVEAMYMAFGENREFTSEDIISALSASVPLSTTMSERIGELRQWAERRARMAS